MEKTTRMVMVVPPVTSEYCRKNWEWEILVGVGQIEIAWNLEPGYAACFLFSMPLIDMMNVFQEYSRSWISLIPLMYT